MSYDADKTPQVLDQLREPLARNDYKDAVQILRHAAAGGAISNGPGLLASLRDALGERHASGITRAFATDACRYCTNGRERCAECEGKGYLGGGKVCLECAGLGVLRCPFCNGTALAGYDFVPRGLRPAVVSHRLALARRRLADLTGNAEPDASSAPRLARRIIEIDQFRGVLANAAEQVRLQGASAPGRPLFSQAERARVEQECLTSNTKAETAMRRLLTILASVYADKVQRARKDDQRRTLYAHRAKTFATLSRSKRFETSALETPQSLRGNGN